MRTRLLTASAALAALLLPMSVMTAANAAPAARARVDVLTIGKVGGRNVATKAILKAGLSGKSAASFVSGKFKLTCKGSTFTAKVTKNPAKPGIAKESLTAQTFSKCSTNATNLVSSVTVKVNKLPYTTTINDKGDHVTVTGPTTTVTAKLTALAGGGTATCVFHASKIIGIASNKHQTIAFSKQKFTLVKSASSGICSSVLSSGEFYATYGPVVDKSVKGSPHVFVN
jgi:hypothetical protein